MHVSIAVASKHGSTAEIAAVVAEEVAAAGHQVSVHDVATSSALAVDDADAIILGSAVYYGRWLLSARVFAEDLALRLDGRPVWMFSSGPVGDPSRPDPDEVDVDDQVALTRARAHRVLAGRLDRGLLHRGERAVVTALRSPEGDFRDWGAVRAWAREVVQGLDDPHPTTH